MTPTKTPIEAALVAICKDKRPLDPAKYKKHPALLDAPAVVAAAGRSPTQARLAWSASTVIRHLISELPATDHLKHVAEAMFGVGDYNDKPPGERADLLDENHEIKEDKYKDTRPKVFEALDYKLSLDTPILPTPYTRRDRFTPRENVMAHKLAAATAELHFAGLLYLFILSRPDEDHIVRPNVWPAVTDWFFYAWLEVASYTVTNEAPTVESALSGVAGIVPRVTRLFQNTFLTLGPQLSKEAIETIRFFANGLVSDIDEANMEDLARPWRAWLRDDRFAFQHRATHQRVELMIGGAGAVAQLISGAITLEVPVWSDGRRIAYKTLSYLCSFDEMAPVFEGQSIRALADIYFDGVGTRLITEALKHGP